MRTTTPEAPLYARDCSPGPVPAPRAMTAALRGEATRGPPPGARTWTTAHGAEAHGQRGVEAPSPAPAQPPARPAAQQGGGVAAPAGVRLIVGSPHTPSPQTPIRWTIKGGQNRVDIRAQGWGGQKWNGRCRRWGLRPIGFSTTWVGSGSRIGSGRAAGLGAGTWLRRGLLRRRRRGVAISGWRGICRCSRLGTGVLPQKTIPRRRGGTWSCGVGRGRTRGGRLTGSRRRGGGRGPRSRASSDCLTRAGATSRCERRSATRSTKRCRGRCEDATKGEKGDEKIDVVAFSKLPVIGGAD